MIREALGAVTVDVAEELAEARLTPFHRRLCLMMGLLTFFDGYDTFNPAYVIHVVSGPWGLRPAQAGLLVSSGLCGFLLGAAGHGAVADRLGRRPTLLGGLWVVSLFSIATALLADSFVAFCVLRVLTGLGLGVLFPLATTYVSEFAPRRSAHTLVLRSVGLGWALGGVAAGVAGALVIPRFGWQALYWLGGLSLLMLPWLHRQLPESAQFLALAGRREALCGLLGQLRPERALLYRQALFTSTDGGLARRPLALLLGARYRARSLVLWATAFLGLFCIFGLTGWVPSVMMQRGEGFAASFGFGALLQLMSFIGALCCGGLMDRFAFGHRLLTLWWALGAGAVFALAAFDSHAVNLLGVAAAGFFCIGAMLVLNNVAAAAYDTSVRASGVGMMLGVGRVGAILGPFVAGGLQQIDGTPRAMFVALGCASLLAGASIACLPRGAAVLKPATAPAAAG